MEEAHSQLCQLLSLFYGASKIPLLLRLPGGEARAWPEGGPLGEAVFDSDTFFGGEADRPCLLSPGGPVLWGRLPLPAGGLLLIGPMPAKPFGEELVRSLSARLQVPPARRRDFRRMLSAVPVLEKEQCRSLCAFLLAGLSGPVLGPEEIPLIGTEKASIDAEPGREAIRQPVSPLADLPLYELIREGDVFTLQELLRIRERAFLPDEEEEAGRCQRSAMRFLAQAGYALIQGGIPKEQAQDLVSGFLKQARMVRGELRYRELVRAVSETFCERVREQKKAGAGSSLTDRIAAYVGDHLFEPLSVQQIAGELHFHPGYVSSAFYDGNGVHLKAYIISRKLGQACRLLKYSDRSLSEISSLLSFTDQSHFQRTFRSHLGITPDRYRRQNAYPGQEQPGAFY